MEKATNGQFREFIGKLLVKGNDENVAKIDKIKIQESILSLSSSDDSVFKNFIHFINNGCRVIVTSFCSEIIKKGKTIIIPDCPEMEVSEKSIFNFLKPVSDREKKIGNVPPKILITGKLDGFQNEVWHFHGHSNGKKLLASTAFKTTRYDLLKVLTTEEIIDEVEILGIKKIYSFIEALSLFREAIISGEVDEKNKRIFCFLKIKKEGSLLSLCSYRYDGYGNQLVLSLDKAHPHVEHNMRESFYSI